MSLLAPIALACSLAVPVEPRALGLPGLVDEVRDRVSPGEAAPAPAWLGSWTQVDVAPGAEPQQLWLEPERVGRIRGAAPEFFRARHSESGVRLERWARFRDLEITLDGERLRVQEADAALVFERSSRVPAPMRMEPYPLAQGVAVDAGTVAMLARDLAERREVDQSVRTNGAANDPAAMQRVDADNTEFLLAIIQEFGWIDAERFGPVSSDAAFLIVQHSPDLRLMCTALPRIEADVRAGRLGGQAFALLHDRVQLNLGYLQRYGSQIGVAEDGRSYLMPCEDLERVDERRAEMGMGPLAEYLAYFADESGPPKHLGE